MQFYHSWQGYSDIDNGYDGLNKQGKKEKGEPKHAASLHTPQPEICTQYLLPIDPPQDAQGARYRPFSLTDLWGRTRPAEGRSRTRNCGMFAGPACVPFGP